MANDDIKVAAYPSGGMGLALDATGKLPAEVLPRVQSNGTDIAGRHNLNLIAGTGVTLTVTDTPASDRVDVTVTATSTAPRILTGQITSAGGITAGTGFTAARNGTGDYTITFTSAFTTAAVVSGQALAGNNARIFVVDGTVTSSARIYIFDITGTHQDATFFFVATQVQ